MQVTGITVQELEDLLEQPEYKAFKRLNYKELSDELFDGVKIAERVITFGQGIITLFDDLMRQTKRIPTQKEYINAGMVICEKFWKEQQYTLNTINGYPFTKGVKLGCMNRLARTYTSKIVELHLELLLKELGFKVMTHPLIDSIMGVDIVAEDDYKRYYIHVTTSSKGHYQAEKSVMAKEKRGKFKVGDAWVVYGRDFKKDCILCYEYGMQFSDGSTKWINNNPVFTKEYIEHYFSLRKCTDARGELLTNPNSKLDYFKAWAEANLKVQITL